MAGISQTTQWQESSVLPSPSPTGMATLSWLWEDRADELVTPGPLSQKPLGTNRPLPAWEDFAVSMASCQSGWDDEDYSAIDFAQQTTYRLPPAQVLPPRRMTPRRPARRRRVASMRRPASLLTVAQAEVCPAGSSAMWRGLGLPSSLADRHLDSLEIAKHRKDCALQRAREDRAKSKAYRELNAVQTSTGLREDNPDGYGSGFRQFRSPFGGGGGVKANNKWTRAFSKVKIGHLKDPDDPGEEDDEDDEEQVTPAPAGTFFSRAGRSGPTPKHERDESIRKFRAEGMLEQQMLGDMMGATASTPASPANPTSPFLTPVSPTLPRNNEDPQSPKTPKRRASISAILNLADTDRLADPMAMQKAKTEPAPSNPWSSLAKAVKKPETPKDEPTSPKTGKKSLIMKSRMRRLLERRKQEFSEWAPAEQTRLRQAFNAGDPSGLAMLNAQGLRLAFAELGLEGRTREEKAAIANISREAAIRSNINFFDFVFQLVAEVEQKLEELRSPERYAEFQKLDTEKLGRLKESQCLSALEINAKTMQVDEDSMQTFWKGFVKDFPDMFREITQAAEGHVDFRGFQLLQTQFDSRRADFQAKLEKRIACVESLPAQLEALHLGEISILKKNFDLSDTNSEGCLQVNDAIHALIQCGVAATVGPMWDRLHQIMANESEGYVFGFKSFLQMIDGIRDDTKGLLKACIMSLFKSYNWTSPPSISASDVPALMTELPFCSDCCISMNELVRLAEASDTEGGGDLDTEGLVQIILIVMEKCRHGFRDAESVLARQVNFSTKEMLQLREAFAALTSTGYVGVMELKAWFKEINPEVGPSIKEIIALIEDVTPRPAPELNLSKDEDSDAVADSDNETGKAAKESTSASKRIDRGLQKASLIKKWTAEKLADKVEGEMVRAGPGMQEIKEKPEKKPCSESMDSPPADRKTVRTGRVLGFEATIDEEDPMQEDDEEEDPDPDYKYRLYFDGYMRLMALMMKA